ncbi:hypothetical protein KIPB_006768, partial [Kipferlia bialata]
SVLALFCAICGAILVVKGTRSQEICSDARSSVLTVNDSYMSYSEDAEGETTYRCDVCLTYGPDRYYYASSSLTGAFSGDYYTADDFCDMFTTGLNLDMYVLQSLSTGFCTEDKVSAVTPEQYDVCCKWGTTFLLLGILVLVLVPVTIAGGIIGYKWELGREIKLFTWVKGKFSSKTNDDIEYA